MKISNTLFSRLAKQKFFLSTILGIFFISATCFAQLDTKIEAENSSFSGTTILKNSTVTPANASNGKWILLKNNPNGTLVLTVNNIPTAGSYKLNMYHFNNNTSQGADFKLN